MKQECPVDIAAATGSSRLRGEAQTGRSAKRNCEIPGRITKKKHFGAFFYGEIPIGGIEPERAGA